MFDLVDPRQSFPALEAGILKYWREEDTFKRSIRHRSVKRMDALEGTEGGTKEEHFSFYDGPPFATGLPHYGHLLAGTIKDVIPRYQTMRGKRVERRFGWDCHGLPIENLIEKEHGIKSKKEIEEMGVAAFNALCRASVRRYTKEWRTVVERMGRWVDMDWDYRTMDPDFMESIWWVFRELADKKLIYEGYKSMHVCPRCETPLSNFEVTQGYKDIDDYSIIARFQLLPSSGGVAGGGGKIKGDTYILAWTTTGWTLPGNLFLAVGKDVRYVTVEHEGSRYILAKERLEDVFKGKECTMISEMDGASLVGEKYLPLFPCFAEQYKKQAFHVVDGSSFVTTEDGTGIVHIAPGYGEDDYQVGLRESVKPLQHVGMNGKFISAVTDFAGKDAKPKDDHTSGDKMIADWLKKHGKLFKAESFRHSYPHCWRCDSPLINYATSSWFVAVEKIKKDMLAANTETDWVPSHLRDGRFGKWLKDARDWAISRNRYWGTPLPIWRSKETGDMEVIGSRDDLMAKIRIRFTKVTVLRHGESEGNVTPVYQGIPPGTNLTKRGTEQAKAAGDVLSREEVAQIYASPLARTRETAEILKKHTDANVLMDDRLREVAFGDYEGKTVDFSDLTFVKARRAHKLEQNQIESIYHFPGMETWSAVEARTGEFLKEVLPRHRGEHIVIVTHADPLLSIKHFFTREDPAKLTHQPYPVFAEAESFFYDHDASSAMDLHKEFVDTVTWPSSKHETSVDMTLVRHGQTDWNEERLCQGQEGDRPLTDLGRNQAKELAKTLKKKKYDAIVTSDLIRAKETAEILGRELGLPITEETDLLRERKFGRWVGMKLDDIVKKHPLRVETGEFGVHHETAPKGETLSEFLARAEKAADYLRARHAGKRILVVTHGGMIQALAALEWNLPYLEALTTSPKNCASIELPLHPRMRRIEEVLDCWFESGSMPYAQSHFPFAFAHKRANEQTSKRKTPPGFPADFIAEGIDQTRGWFYTLTVLSAALFKKPAFWNCVVNGTVLAEDGKKMSKRLKNYPEPLEVVLKHGADAVRFALMSSPAVRGEDLRFSEKIVEETVRSVLLPFWNTYSFFVTYANTAKWQPTASRKSSGHPLDQWILAEVQDLVNRMTKELDAYELSATCSELYNTIDALTNWYVRLSRRRFAGKGSLVTVAGSMDENEQEQNAALSTLYDVLITFSQLLAPFCPFIAEAVYLNLVPEDHGSVHLTDWPEPRKLTAKEEQLITKTRVLRAVVSLGKTVRAEKKVKSRQPLPKAVIAIPKSLCVSLAPSEVQLLQEELNVKNIEMMDDPGTLAKPVAMVDARKVGPRLGGRVQEVIQAGKRGDFETEEDGSVLILDEKLSPDEVKIVYQPPSAKATGGRGKEGEGVAFDRGIVVKMDTRLSEELKREGLARDIIRAIQQLRKERGYEIQDMVTIGIEGADDVLQEFRPLIEQETNVKIDSAKGGRHTVDLDGKTATIILPKK
ncbi:MAG: class I tRNA ligase family protein [Patescibacteria group bacterium]